MNHRQSTSRPSFARQRCGYIISCGHVALATAMFYLAGCTSEPTHQQVQQQAVQATEAVKQGAEQAATATRKAAASAEQGVNEVAAGVKTGLHEDAAEKVNINNATQIRLAMLPGISVAQAGTIVAQRPYSSPHQLVSRGIVTARQYEKIAEKISAQ